MARRCTLCRVYYTMDITIDTCSVSVDRIAAHSLWLFIVEKRKLFELPKHTTDNRCTNSSLTTDKLTWRFTKVWWPVTYRRYCVQSNSKFTIQWICCRYTLRGTLITMCSYDVRTLLHTQPRTHARTHTQ